VAAKTIDASQLKSIFLAGAKRLEANKEWINELNVFPVPDGDTGTNMTMTINSAASEIRTLENPSMETLAKAISSGSLRGARGNSGVIMSQLLRGFTKEIKKVSIIDEQVIVDAFQKATETAYKAVMKPKEGTILTVARAMSDKAVELQGQYEDLEGYFNGILEYGDYMLSQTPEMLPVLKEAGVVDSGGQGLMLFLKGCMDCFLGKEEADVQEAAPEPEILFAYSTAFTLCPEEALDEKKETKLRGYLEALGAHVTVAPAGALFHISLETNDPGLVLQKALSYGQIKEVSIANLHFKEEVKVSQTAEAASAKTEEPVAEQPRKEVGFIAISVGDGMSEIFKELGVDVLIEGGQTMNPSTEDILNAIARVNADVVYVLPNNKNIILAAEQAVHLTKDKRVVVVPSKTIPQGITAVISYMEGKSPEENLEQMTEEMNHVKTGQVTYAVRNTTVDGVEVHEGDIMGLDDHAIRAVGQEVEGTTYELLCALVDEDSELISIYYGSDVTEEEANALLERAQAKFPGLDIEIHAGGQPIYYYVISVE
jgi:DAK2 domain fusion protein YloV